MHNTPKLLWVTDLRFEPGWESRPHAHANHFELLLVTEGRIALRTEATTATGRPGSLICYAPDREHYEWTDGNQSLRLFCLAWQHPENALPMQNWSGEDMQGRLQFLLRWMTEIFPGSCGAERDVLNTLLQAVVYEGARTSASPEQASVWAAQRYACANLAAPLDLDMLAEVACLSRFHFARVFKRETGQSPMAFVRRARVEAARSLLATTQLSLEAIAIQVGLGDACHLARVVQHVTGQSPSKLRRLDLSS